MGNVPAYDKGAQPAEITTVELLTLAVNGTPLDAIAISALAEAIDSGLLARSAATPNHEPVGLDLPAGAKHRMVGVLELARRAASAPPPTVIRRQADVVAIAQRELGGRDRECVLVIVCDAANAVIGTELVSRGAVDKALLPVREILVAAIRVDGRAFAVAHNHPSGELAASASDTSSTESLSAAAHTVGLRFLGHASVSPLPTRRAQAEPNTWFSEAGRSAFAA